MKDLLQYLTDTQVRQLFCGVQEVVGPGSQMVFSYTGWDPDRSQPRAGWVSWLMLPILRNMGEPWLWGIESSQLEPFLAELGWRQLPNPVPSISEHGAGAESYAVATF